MATIYEALRLLSAYGWRQEVRIGEVRILSHPGKPGVRLVLRGPLSKEIGHEALRAILRDGGLGEEQP